MLQKMLVIIILLLALSACATTGTTPNPADTPVIHVNPADTVLIASALPGGPVIFGDRDAEGIPTRITEVIIPAETYDPADTTHAFFDTQQRLDQVVLSNGDTATFEYVSATRLFMTITSLEANDAARVDINLDGAALNNQVQATNLSPLAEGLIGTVESHCGVTPVNGMITGKYSRPSESKETALSFTALSGGTWQYSLPALPVADAEMAQKAKAALAAVKKYWGILCGEGTAGTVKSIADFLGGAIGVDPIKETCSELFPDIKDTNGQITKNRSAIRKSCEVAAKRLEELCPLKDILLEAVEHNVEDTYSPTGYNISISISYPGKPYKATSSSFFVAADQASIPPVISEITSDQAQITTFTVSPIDPSPGQSYTVTADTECAADGDSLRISVVGSDGFTKETEQAISSENTSASLSVPGAKKDVVDVIKANILPSGPEKSLSVTF